MLVQLETRHRVTKTVVLIAMMVVFLSNFAFGHCDSEDGPIIPAIRTSLENGEIEPLLKWIAPEDESEIRKLFDRVREVRSQSSEAKQLADRLFIETFIRIHRASEGAPFTGIKEAGSNPLIFAELDQALESGSVDALADKVANAVREGIVERFDRAVALKQHQDESVEAGRKYVAAYVTYMHFVEGLHNYLSTAAEGHHSSADGAHDH